MSTALYEELGISKDATTEQIRKAYKKLALKTHPDRLPPGASPEEKAASEEMFRKVNNAYEVLSDPVKRSEYDIHGVWPPPEVPDFMSSRMPGGHSRPQSRHTHAHRSQSYPDPFFDRMHSPFVSFQFTDPFILFESIFEGTPWQHHSSHHRHRHHHHSRPVDPFSQMFRMQAEIEGFMNNIDRDPFGMGGGFPRRGVSLLSPMTTFPSMESRNDSRVHWVSESSMTSTVNGVTQTIQKRIDSDGNEFVTRKMPDGREYRTVNGVEQHSRGYLPYSSPAPPSRHQQGPDNRYLSQQNTRTQPIPSSSSRGDYSAPPPYPGPRNDYRDGPHSGDYHQQRPRRSSEKLTYPSTGNVEQVTPQEERHHQKKKWWQGH